MTKIFVTVIISLVFLFPVHLLAQSDFQLLGSLSGVGSLSQSLVGPGETPDSQKYYLNYYYPDHPGDLVVIDPKSNPPFSVTTYPFPEGSSAPGMVIGPDNNLYLGTILNAYILKFDIKEKRFIYTKSIPPDPNTGTEQNYIYGLTRSPFDHKIYGCTFPSADLIRFDPQNPNPTIENLGSMDPENKYAAKCFADNNSSSPYIYVGTGSIDQKIIAYNINTRTKTTLVHIDTAQRPNIWQGIDNNIYGSILDSGTKKNYKLSQGQATINMYQPAKNDDQFANGDTIEISKDGATITVTHNDESNNTYPFYPNKYVGGPQRIFRIGLGPDNNLYLGGILPFFLTRYTLNSPHQFSNLGYFGAEPYSMLTAYSRLNIASYESAANLMSYDPSQAITPIPYRCTGTSPNPQCIPNTATTTSIRPMALVSAPNNDLYIGSSGIYGEIKGPLIRWNLQTNQTNVYYPFPTLGITSLVTIPIYVNQTCQGNSSIYCLVGGTTIHGGGGTTPPPGSTALLFTWNPATNKLLHSYQIPGTSKVTRITNLIQSPVTKYVYGMADNKLFIFSPSDGQFIGTTIPLSFNPAISSNYNNIAIGSDNNIWGIAEEGVFKINITTSPRTPTAELIAPFSSGITAGFAYKKDPILGDMLYFGSNSKLYSYDVPIPHQVLQGDLNADSKVDILDYNILLSNFGKTGAVGWIRADIIKNGKVDIFDFNKLVENFGL